MKIASLALLLTSLSGCHVPKSSCQFLDNGFLDSQVLRGLPNYNNSANKITDQIIKSCYANHKIYNSDISFMRQAIDKDGNIYYIYIPDGVTDIALVFKIDKAGAPIAAYRD